MIFSPHSRVWIYQSNRAFTNTELAKIEEKLNNFTAQWSAHGKLLKAKAEIPNPFFIVLIVDENQAPATGCSIDSSVKVIKEIEAEFGVDLFDRFNMAYKDGEQIKVNSKSDFETLISIKKINADTIVFNNMVQTLAEYQSKWEVPIKNSWHNLVFAEQLNS